MNVCQYNECDVTNLIIRYLEPLIQLLSGTMKEYNMMMKTTKCLNTAVMLTYILGGSDKLKDVEYCEVSKINKRYDKKLNKSEYKKAVFNKLQKDLSKKNIKKRYFYYILMTNNNMNRSNILPQDASESQFFPGHVFIIDKFPVCKSDVSKFNIYQSYINQYDLKGHFKRNNNSMRLKNNDISFLLSGIENIISKGVWNENAVKFWQEFTYVDTTNLINYKTNKINLCYSKIRIDYCYKEFYKFINKKIRELSKDIKNNTNLNRYQIKNLNVNDEFYIKQLTPDKLLLKLIELSNELIEKIKIYE